MPAASYSLDASEDDEWVVVTVEGSGFDTFEFQIHTSNLTGVDADEAVDRLERQVVNELRRHDPRPASDLLEDLPGNGEVQRERGGNPGRG